ncbi:unnamed protein product [Polarella glacialis]|uniref:Uncharacterized protein n=1 Tax=Polarella glacialis TaxID=89957 RepID=A0A813HA09_POLGL|nr:unnamed protein product [Polarella glacialis]
MAEPSCTVATAPALSQRARGEAVDGRSHIPGLGRAQQPGSKPRRGGAPSQRRGRSASQWGRGSRSAPGASGTGAVRSQRPASAVAGTGSGCQAEVRPGWDNDNRTGGVFDSSMRPKLLLQSQLGQRLSNSSQLFSSAPALGMVRATRSAPTSARQTSARKTSARQTSARKTPRRQRLGLLRQRLEASMLPGPARPLEPVPAFGYGAGDSSSSSRAATGPGTPEASWRGISPSARSVLKACPQLPLLPWPAPEPLPALAQLDVLHLQRRPGHFNALTILMPDGSVVGSAESAAANVVLMPGVEVRAGLPASETGAAIQLRPPVTPADKLMSVSQRLSALLRPSEVAQQKATEAASEDLLRRRERAKMKPEVLLRRCQADVLSQVDLLTDAVLQHLLGDTVELLNRLPEKAPADDLTASESGVWRASEQRAGASECRAPAFHGTYAVATEKLDSLGVRTEFLHKAAWMSAAELDVLEMNLVQAYGASSSGSCAVASVEPEIHGSVLHPIEDVAWRKSPISDSPDSEDELRPGGLPLERVRKLEQYRTRFAQHCLSAREAGIDRTPGGTSTATWVIWPYLADQITMAAVEAAIEETHDALERHVDDLVRAEVGVCDEMG